MKLNETGHFFYNREMNISVRHGASERLGVMSVQHQQQ